jgi:transposase-like protein
MIVVWSAAEAQSKLACGRMSCSSCAGVLAPWGYARTRSVRSRGGLVQVRPRRTRCRACKKTHVVLPGRLLPRRSVTVEVIGEALRQAVTGRGHRGIAAELGFAADTVRGWIRRACANAERLRYIGTQMYARADASFGPITPAGSALGDAVEVLALAAMALRRRFDVHSMPAGIGPWELIAAFTRGTLLAPPARSG